MFNRILKKILAHSLETKSFIGVRKSNTEGLCWVGYIVDFNDQLIVLQHISPLGLEDGLIVEKIENIDNFETDDNYVKAVRTLYDLKKKIASQEITQIDISINDNWQYEMLQSTFDQGKIISVELRNSDNIDYGYVLDFDYTTLQLSGINNIGEEIGIQTYRLSDISSLSVDRIEARKRETLFLLNKPRD
jgi:hypothetical protein